METQRRNCSNSSSMKRYNNYLSLAVLLTVFAASPTPVHGWGSSSSKSDSQLDQVYFGNKFSQDWLYSSSKLSFKIEGCVWGNVADSEEVGCLEDESEEGTTNWYMMANCHRPQVAFSVYSSGSCNSGNFEGSVSQSSFLLLSLLIVCVLIISYDDKIICTHATLHTSFHILLPCYIISYFTLVCHDQWPV